MNKKRKDILKLLVALIIVVLLNIIGSYSFFRLDLTSEKRYTLSDATKGLLENLDETVYFKVYLEGDLNPGFKRLRDETKQMLNEFRAYSSNVEFDFINPSENPSKKDRENIYKQLQTKGLNPIQIEQEGNDGTSYQVLFPGALIAYGEGSEFPVQLLNSQIGVDPEIQLNSSIQNLEYALANSIRRVSTKNRKKIAFLEGNGELESKYVADMMRTLSENYRVSRFDIREFKSDSTGTQLSIAEQQQRLNLNDLIIIAKPTEAFSDLDRYLIDQYIMNGGKAIWLIDAVRASMDSLQVQPEFLALPQINDLNITDMLFKYGVRLNGNLIQDLTAASVNDQRRTRPWVYFPAILPVVKHPITKNLNAIKLEFPSTLDTLKSPNIRKEILLKSSPFSRRLVTPTLVSLRDLYQPPSRDLFREQFLPVGVLLEGTFESVYKGRIKPKIDGINYYDESKKETQMIVIADGDIIKNQINLIVPDYPKGNPLPLGYDQFTGTEFGNKDFMLNAIDYMLDDTNLISIRSRDIVLRLLNKPEALNNKVKWQLINTLAPILLIILLGVIKLWLRKRKYAR